MGFKRVGDDEVAGPMATVIMNAIYTCEWAPGYDWIVVTDAWITSASSEPAAKKVRSMRAQMFILCLRGGCIRLA